MRLAETVTFGGSGLDRAAELRGDPQGLAALRPTGRALLLWRGKILAQTGPDQGLAHLPCDHPILEDAGAWAFLGRDEGGFGWFAYDISAWEPTDMGEADLGAFMDPTAQHHPDLPADHCFLELRGIMTGLSAREAELAATAKAILGWHSTHRFCARCGERLEITMSGWQADCPDCGGHHFPRTDPVVIMLITHGNDVLVGRSKGWPEGLYSLLAGFVDPGETIEAAVRREVFEESGIKVGRVSYLASQPWPYPSSLMFGCHGEALTKDLTIDLDEIEDARWMSREEMLDVYAGRSTEILPARKGAIAHFLIEHWLADRLD